MDLALLRKGNGIGLICYQKVKKLWPFRPAAIPDDRDANF